MMVEKKLSDEDRDRLVRIAMEARKWAYTPYSGYHVGAALLAESGRIYDGVNIENAAYSATVCAERVAIFKAVSEGEREFKAIAIVTEDGGFSCGECRQVLSEFGLDTLVLVVNAKGEVTGELALRDLLPHSFGADSLDMD